METNHEAEVSDEDWAPGWKWAVVDDSLILVGLLILQASLFKSGYSAEVMTEIQERLNKLIRYYGKKGS